LALGKTKDTGTWYDIIAAAEIAVEKAYYLSEDCDKK